MEEYYYSMTMTQPMFESKKLLSSSSSDTQVGEIEEIEDEVYKKFRLFNRFDVVSGPFDHYFFCSQLLTKRISSSFLKITEEWKMLEEKLPNSIYVRAYKERLDLMRAVIVGQEGTPYHNCLFFFDIQFPSDYPLNPPKLYYYSHGLRLNPNLRTNGEVSAWHGSILKEKWSPGQSTILSYLVSVQDLVLNSKPYFNRPGCEYKIASPIEEEKSKAYNKDIMMVSFKAMLYTLRSPPKHFEEFVAGHFRKQSHDILMACKGCMHSDEGLNNRIFMELLCAFEANGSYCKHFVCDVKEEQIVVPILHSDQEQNKDGYGKKIFNKLMNSFCV
ncbi:Ubiquitin-conjugating enzyme [Macleaya cordata]|uniref:Ubiquitin-conjugating enzyme n=1 Tax=Macleaya cordata TaxID=56857 RepID=A0A200R260_MACCD|nr:Ubiquitin-conjugating enzyme [Macleaya cordata]